MSGDVERKVILKFNGIKLGEHIDTKYDCGAWSVLAGGTTPPMEYNEADGLLTSFPGAFEVYFEVLEDADEHKSETPVAVADVAAPELVAFDTNLEPNTESIADQILVKVTRKSRPEPEPEPEVEPEPEPETETGPEVESYSKRKLLAMRAAALRKLYKKTRMLTGADFEFDLANATKKMLVDAIVRMTNGA